jgi:rubrerythrin
MLESRLKNDNGYMAYVYENLQQEIGRELVAYLWNQKVPVVVELKPEERRPVDPHYWDTKELIVRARVNPVKIHSLNLDYHMAQLSQTIRVPHFEYFPKDWVCGKCGCIVDGYHAPRLCDRCGAPRSPRAAMVEAMR